MRIQLLIFISFIIRHGGAQSTIIILNDLNGTIISPGFPDQYPPNISMEWRLETQTVVNISLNISLSLEYSESCKADRLFIKDAMGSDFHTGYLCGNSTVATSLYFLGYGFRVYFTSDHSVSSQGFMITYVTTTPEMTFICDMMHRSQSNKISTRFLGGTGRYPNMAKCAWSFDVPDNHFMCLKFDHFNIEYSGEDCDNDRVEVWTRNEREMLSRVFCGQRLPWPMTLDAKTVIVRFTTDVADNREGFTLSYSITDQYWWECDSTAAVRDLKASPTPNRLNLPFTELSANQHDQIVWRIRTNPGFDLQLESAIPILNSFALIDGPNESFGQVVVDDGATTVLVKGFILTLYPLAEEPGNQISITFHATIALNTENTNIHHNRDVSYIHYKPQEHVCCIFVQTLVTAGMFSKITFPKGIFNISSNVEDCAYNGVVIYSGSVSFEGIIGPFCDTSDSHMFDILKNFVGDTTLFVVIYSYTINKLYPNILSTTGSGCKGYHLGMPFSGPVQETKDPRFTMVRRRQNQTDMVDINFSDSEQNCAVIYFLPELSYLKQLHVFLSGKFRYRVCKQWNILDRDHLDPKTAVSKYARKETCTKPQYADGDTVTLLNVLTTSGKWSKVISRLEMGPVHKRMCEDVYECPSAVHKNHIFGGCGSLLTVNCDWNLIVPDEIDSSPYYWKIGIKQIQGSALDDYVELSEYMDKQYVVIRTKVWLRNIGIHSAFKYNSISGTNISVITRGLKSMDVTYELDSFADVPTWETLEFPGKSGKIKIIKCAKFESSCFFLDAHQSRLSWETSRAYCRSFGADLGRIPDQEVLKFIKFALATVWKNTFYKNKAGLVFIGLTDLHQSGDYRWVDGAPLTVSDWFYDFDRSMNPLPEFPTLQLTSHKSQPVANRSERCVAMVPSNPSLSTNWRKIDCLEKFNPTTYTLCEIKMSPNKTALVSSAGPDNSKQNCRDGWIYLSGSCVLLLTPDIHLSESVTRITAINLCKTHDGIVANIHKYSQSQLSDLFRSLILKKGKGDIWVRLTDEEMGCISVTLVENGFSLNDIIQKNRGDCHTTEGRVAHVLCETSTRQNTEQCEVYQFECQDGTCLTPDKICDDWIDCTDGEDENNCTVTDQFVCTSGSKIAVSKYCDFHKDCSDGSDEEMCTHKTCSNFEYTCENLQCIDYWRRCDHLRDCIDHSDEIGCEWDVDCKEFRCSTAGCVPRHSFQDLQPDCPDATQSDELFQLVEEKRYAFYVPLSGGFAMRTNYDSECPGESDSQRCHSERSVCFPRHNACVYDHDEYGHLRYCRNGAHLAHCASFQCPGLFKCPRSYCIPFHKVCDGVIDCVDGTDEANCTRQPCPHKLRCGRTSQCVSQDQVCDGQPHCKSDWSDERFCDLKQRRCPDNCTCHGYVLDCSQAALTELPGLDDVGTIRALNLGRNFLSGVTKTTFMSFLYLANLDLSWNKLNCLGPETFVYLFNLIHMDLSGNEITAIEPLTFAGLSKLRVLKLKGNPIQILNTYGFMGLSSLPLLNLSNMMFEELPGYAFFGMNRLRILDLRNNNIRAANGSAFSLNHSLEWLSVENNSMEGVESDVFKDLNLGRLMTESFRFCCHAKKSVKQCTPKSDIFSSCVDLLASNIARTIVWTFGVLTVFGNSLAILWIRYNIRDKDESVFLLNSCASNLLMGCYLLSLGIVDVHYRGNYSHYDVAWRTSKYCLGLKMAAEISWTASVINLIFFSIQNTFFLYLNKTFVAKFAWLAVSTCWFCVPTLYIITHFAVQQGEEGHNYSICTPLIFGTEHTVTGDFSRNAFMSVNTVLGAVLFSSFVLSLLFKYKVKNDIKASNPQYKLTRFSSVFVFDSLCLVLTLLPLWVDTLGYSLNEMTVSVICLAVFPCSACINPYMFALLQCKSRNS